MLKNNRKIFGAFLFAALILLGAVMAAEPVLAAATDEILDFIITVDVNEDASLEMTYHIDWKVLDDSIGELEWIDLGVPNDYHGNITPLCAAIDHIEDNGSTLAIWLDRPYGEDETVSIDFSMTQDHMYQIDKWVAGETVYTFTPAWFDGMDVDALTVRWNAEKAGAWQRRKRRYSRIHGCDRRSLRPWVYRDDRRGPDPSHPPIRELDLRRDRLRIRKRDGKEDRPYQDRVL